MSPQDFEKTDMPQQLRIVMAFINRIGFPILAFLMMFFLAYVSIQKLTDAVVNLRIAILEKR